MWCQVRNYLLAQVECVQPYRHRIPNASFQQVICKIASPDKCVVFIIWYLILIWKQDVNLPPFRFRTKHIFWWYRPTSDIYRWWSSCWPHQGLSHIRPTEPRKAAVFTKALQGNRLLNNHWMGIHWISVLSNVLHFNFLILPAQYSFILVKSDDVRRHFGQTIFGPGNRLIHSWQIPIEHFDHKMYICGQNIGK